MSSFVSADSKPSPLGFFAVPRPRGFDGDRLLGARAPPGLLAEPVRFVELMPPGSELPASRVAEGERLPPGREDACPLDGPDDPGRGGDVGRELGGEPVLVDEPDPGAPLERPTLPGRRLLDELPDEPGRDPGIRLLDELGAPERDGERPPDEPCAPGRRLLDELAEPGRDPGSRLLDVPPDELCAPGKRLLDEPVDPGRDGERPPDEPVAPGKRLLDALDDPERDGERLPVEPGKRLLDGLPDDPGRDPGRRLLDGPDDPGCDGDPERDGAPGRPLGRADDPPDPVRTPGRPPVRRAESASSLSSPPPLNGRRDVIPPRRPWLSPLPPDERPDDALLPRCLAGSSPPLPPPNGRRDVIPPSRPPDSSPESPPRLPNGFRRDSADPPSSGLSRDEPIPPGRRASRSSSSSDRSRRKTIAHPLRGQHAM